MLRGLDDHGRKGLLKYSDRGWKDWTLPDDERQAEKAFPRSLGRKPPHHFRRVGDSKTWMVELDVEAVRPPLTPDFVLEHACFTIGNWDRHAEKPPGPSFLISAKPYTNLVLEYTYTDDWGLQTNESFWRDIQHKLNELTKIEIDKMDEEDRPDWFTAFFTPPETPGHPNYMAARHAVNKPPTWTYYDDQVPKWYADWESEKSAHLGP